MEVTLVKATQYDVGFSVEHDYDQMVKITLTPKLPYLGTESEVTPLMVRINIRQLSDMALLFDNYCGK